MARLCSAIRKDGKPCGNLAGRGGLCRHHRPDPPPSLTRAFRDAGAGGGLSLRAETAVVQALIAEAVGALRTENSQATWEELGGLAKEFSTAIKPERKLDLAERMCSLIRTGSERWRQVELLLEYIEFKRKLAESEQKRVKLLEESLDSKQASELVQTILSVIERCVADPAARADIAKELGHVSQGR